MIKIFLQEIFYRAEWEVFICREVEGHGRYFKQPNGTEVFVSMDDYNVIANIQPLFSLTTLAAQVLIEELQKAGVRPRELNKTEGLLEAQSAHLADLRNILTTGGLMK